MVTFIAISASPTILQEEQGTSATITFSSNQQLLPENLLITVDSSENIQDQFVVSPSPTTEGLELVEINPTSIQVRLTQQIGTLTLPVSDDSDPDSPLDITFTLRQSPDYTVDPNNSSITLTIQDEPTLVDPNNSSITLTIQDEPTLDDTTISGFEDFPVLFVASDFADAFIDDEEDNLQSLFITALPEIGTLSLNETEVALNQEIEFANFDNLVYTPAPNQNGEVSFQVVATDGTEFTQEANVIIDLTAVNDAPSFTLSDISQEFLAGEPISLENFATDISTGAEDEADQILTFNITTVGDEIFSEQPSLDVDTGTLSYILAPDTQGIATVSVTLSDDGGTDNGGADTSAEQTFTITSIAANVEPTLDDITISGFEDFPVLFVASDFADAFIDDEEDNLQSLFITALPEIGTLSLNETEVALNQEIEFANLDNLVYTPAPNQNGEVSFQVIAFDGTEFTQEANVIIDLTAVNDAPSLTLSDISQEFLAGEAISIQNFATDISTGAEDEADQILIVEVATVGDEIFTQQPSLNPDTGTLSYILAPDTQGTATVSITLSDNGGTEDGGEDTSAEQTFTITSIAPNVEPTLDDITISGFEDFPVLFAASDFADAFTDDEEDNLQSLFITTLPNIGVLSLNGTAVRVGELLEFANLDNLRYSAPPNQNGEVSFQVIAFDGTEITQEANVIINLTAVNDAPTFTLLDSLSQEFFAGEAISIENFATNISRGSEDEADQILISRIRTVGDDIFTQQPTLDPVTGTLSYVLAPDTQGTATVSIIISDNGGTDNGGEDTSAEQTFTITSIEPSIEPSNGFSTANRGVLVNNFVFNTTSLADGTDVIARLGNDVLALGTEAEFDNLVGLYEVVDSNGGVDTNGDSIADLFPEQEGYAQAAIENRVDNLIIRAGSSGNPTRNTTVEEFGDILLEGGRFYAPFVIANAGDLGFDEFITRENQEQDGQFNDAADFREDVVAYFAFVEANPDGSQHLQSRGNNIFGFEDLPGNLSGISDNDFNDAIFQFGFSLVA
jgi:hypothetical protein